MNYDSLNVSRGVMSFANATGFLNVIFNDNLIYVFKDLVKKNYNNLLNYGKVVINLDKL